MDCQIIVLFQRFEYKSQMSIQTQQKSCYTTSTGLVNNKMQLIKNKHPETLNINEYDLFL